MQGIPLEYIVIVAVAVSATSFLWLMYLEWRLHRMFKGVSKKNIEQHLATIARDYQDLTAFKDEMYATLSQHDSRIAGGIKGIGTVRFHPFAGSGSTKPSFATALIAENGDGLILSTLHSHGTVSIFSKALTNFKAEKELTEEEAAALEKAKNSLHT